MFVILFLPSPSLMVKKNFKFLPICYRFAHPNTQNIDLDNAFTKDMLHKQNLPLLFHVYDKKDLKDKSLKTLIQLRTKTCNLPLIHNIVETYLKYNDFTGCLLYLKTYEIAQKKSQFFEYYVEAKQVCFKGVKNDKKFTEFIIKGLEYKFEKVFLDLIREYSEKYHKGNLGIILGKINKLFDKKYLEKLDYWELEEIYKLGGNKLVLEKMVKVNAFIEKKYYLEYAKIYGVLKNDIQFILESVYRDWAFAIAYKNNWINKKMRIVIQKRWMGFNE